MRRNLTLLIPFAFVLSGCIQLEMLLKVNKDGTGSIIETVLFDVSTLEDLLKRLPQQGNSRPWDIDEADLKAGAEKKGKGVTFASAAPVTRGKFKGYTANYTFNDVRQITIDPDPGKRAPKGPGQPAEKSNPMRFDFKKGRTSELVVRVPQDESTKGKKEDSGRKIDPNDEGFEMMRGMLRDMKVQIQLEVDGKVASSNAKFREGNRVTLIGLDFNALMNDATRLAEVMNADSYDEAAKAFNAVPGMKIETQKRVKVAFR